jgi:nucleoside-diphosphate-sugar epimerase
VPLVYIDNVVDALMLAATKDLPNGSIFQLVDPEGMRQRDYVDYVRRSGRPVRVSYVPAWFLKLAGFGVEMLGKVLKRPVPLTPYRVRSITPLWPCDCTAAHVGLGWQPRVSIQEGMALTFKTR